MDFNPKDGSPEPGLAESWEFPNDTTLILRIRKGVNFHNLPPVSGREFTAADAVWNLERLRRPGATYIWKGNLEKIDKIEATDRYTVKITLKNPFGPVLFYLRGNYSAAQVMLDKEVEDPVYPQV
ncbi:MAG: ABC transporter substrate-binding protein [Dehalococcoidia bacterium]|nr:ABC transporter substrate-binding protein [Dehalococcoidia bacterium]